MVDLLFVIIERFSLFLTVEMLWGKIYQSRRFSKGDGSLSANILQGRANAHKPMLVSKKLSDCRFVWYQNISSTPFSFVTINVSDRRTDGETDGQNCDSDTVRCITCSHTVKMPIQVHSVSWAWHQLKGHILPSVN